MPRRPRMYIPGFPYHIVQRGNNRKACFFVKDNFAFYLQLWKEISARYGLELGQMFRGRPRKREELYKK